MIKTQNRKIENPDIGDKVWFIQTARETDNKFTLVEVELAPGGSNPLHYHKSYSETFFVLKGNLGVTIGREEMVLKEGEAFTVPAYKPHRFFNPSTSESTCFSVKLEPGSTGFENALQMLYGLANDKGTNGKGIPKNIFDMSLFITWGDTNMPGFLSMIQPLFGLFSRIATKRGRATELFNRYCQIR